MRLKRRKVILGAITLAAVVCIGAVGASVLIGQAVGREVFEGIG